MWSRRAGALLLGLLAQASCSSCPWYYESGTAYSLDETCDGMVTAPPALHLPGAPSANCTAAVGDGSASVSNACLQFPGQCSVVVLFLEAGGLQVTIDANLPPKTSMLNVTLPDPSVKAKAVLSLPGQPNEGLTAVAGEVMLQLLPNHLTSVFGVGFIDAAGDQIALENASLDARGHFVETCDAN